ELGAALCAGISPWTLAAARRLYLATGGSAALGLGGATLLRLLLTAIVLGAPTFLMGGTLPAVARAATAAGDRGRRALGWLYGANTMGAVVGAAATTFVLLETLGQRKSLLVAALVNALVGLTARSWARQGEDTAGDAGRDDEDTEAAAPLGFVLAAAAIVGCAFFLMELVWYRVLAPLLGGSTYTFGTILLLALAGIGIGGLLYGAAAATRLATLRAFATTCALEALLLVVPFVLGERLAVLTAALRQLGALGFGGLVASWLVAGGIVV